MLCALCALTWLMQALSSVCSINSLGRAAHSASGGKHPLEVTERNTIFLERSTRRQQRFCLGTGSNLGFCSNVLFKDIIVAQNIQTQTALVFTSYHHLTWVLDVTASMDSGCSIGRCREITHPMHSSCQHDVEKGKDYARRGETECGKASGSIWGKCIA